MNEEITTNETVDNSVNNTELSTVVDSVKELTEVIKEYQEQKSVEDETQATEEKTTNELLENLLTAIEEQKPTDEEIKAENATTEENQTTLQSIETELKTLNENLVTLTEQSPKEEIVVEGFFFVGLCVVIAIGVHMFWSQISKW